MGGFCHAASVFDKGQPGGSRVGLGWVGSVDDGEDAECVSSKPLQMVGNDPLFALKMM